MRSRTRNVVNDGIHGTQNTLETPGFEMSKRRMMGERATRGMSEKDAHLNSKTN